MLKLSTTGRYGLRAMIDLARAFEHGPLFMSTIAANQRITRGYLHNLLVPLREKGIVTAVRGANGGFSLAMPPEQISVSQIFEALEGKLAVVECLTDDEYCDQLSSCATFPLWSRINRALNQVLESVTLAELAGTNRENVDHTKSCKRLSKRKTKKRPK